MNATPVPEKPAAKFVEPELLYVTEQITIGKADSNQKMPVSQLVRKNTKLIDFPDYRHLKKQGYLRSPIEAGENVLFDAESYTLISTCSGYPKEHFVSQGEGPDILVISLLPVIKLSHDKMQASLVIHPSIPGTCSLKTESIDELLQEAGVSHGIMAEAIEKTIRSINSDYVDFDEIVFAKGLYPGEGQNAYLDYCIEIGPLAGHYLEDGTIDFRDRRIMVGVKNGQAIATKIPPVQGEPGYNVLGESIEPKSGKDLQIKLEGNAHFDIESQTVSATKDGTLSIVNNKIIKVATKTTIPGDVNYTTGHIESENNTVIKGSVQPGFKVTTAGDLGIHGTVSSAQINCGGNAIIKGGITGQNTVIETTGDLDIKFIERGTCKSQGIIVIRKQAYYAHITAGQDIRCAQNSTIVGGILMAGGSLSVHDVGSENSTPAILAAGVDPERYKMLLELQEEYAAQQDEIIKALQMAGSGSRPRKIKKMEKDAHQIKMKLLQINLIPETELFSRNGEGKDREELDEESSLYNQGIDIEHISIDVAGKIVSGAILMIGNRSATLVENTEKRSYRLSKNLKRIMAIPLRKK